MKFRPAWTMGAVVLLVGATLVAIRYIDRIPSGRLASLLGITVTVSDIKATPSSSPRATPVGGDQSALLGSVVVQTFRGSFLVRQGPGTAVSADGLILTTTVTAPYGSGEYVYQVATSRGQVLRAQRVANDSGLGLVLLKAERAEFNAVLFDGETSPLFAGQQLEAISAQVLVSTFTSQRLPLWVVAVIRDTRVEISVDKSFGTLFNGARIIDQSGRSVGLLRFSPGPVFQGATPINAFINSYLKREVKP